MSRELKFRAWDTLPLSNPQIPKVFTRFSLKDMNVGNIKFPDIENWIFMQYTGIRDKDGKEIYEGDIIKYDSSENMNHWVAGETALIIGLPGRFTARMCPFDSYTGVNQNTLNEDIQECVTVIGNVYENPDLLPTPSPSHEAVEDNQPNGEEGL